MANDTLAATETVTLFTGLRRIISAIGLLRESPVGVIGACLVGFWVTMAIFAPLISPYEPNATILPFMKPGAVNPDGGTFWLGTDHIGRDILSRIIWGSRTVLFYAPVATFCAYVLGILMGLVAGYYRGWVDDVLSRIGDMILSFPVLVLYIIIISTIGASGVEYRCSNCVCQRSGNHANRARSGT